LPPALSLHKKRQEKQTESLLIVFQTELKRSRWQENVPLEIFNKKIKTDNLKKV
jgi:hypothetical protein